MTSIGTFVLDKDFLCLRIFFQSRNATRDILDSFFFPSLEVSIESFSKCPHIHLEDLNFHPGDMLHGEHRFFRGIHAADRTAIIMLLLSRSDTLEKCDFLRFSMIRRSTSDMASPRTCGAEHSLKFKACHHI